MNRPLSAPAIRAQRAQVAVIGAGPGGLAAAMLLAARGARVTLLEKDSVVGGRSRTLTTPQGYRFDLGPTFFLYPRILEEIFASCGAELRREVEMVRLDPQYRLVFGGGAGPVLDATPDLDRMAAEIAKLDPEDARALRPFMEQNRAKLAAFRPVLERGFGSAADLFAPDMLKALPHLRPHLSVDAELKRHFRDPRTRLLFSFQTKYLGMSPFRCPSLFTILSFLEYEHGVFHPMGGCGAVATAMARVAERLGVEIRLDTPVERIAFDGRRATGVEAGGQRFAADAVVMNADFAHAAPQLIPDALRRRWSDKRIAGARYSCSTFMLYLGVEGRFPELAHHTILLAEDYQRNLREIEAGLAPAEPSFYLHNPVATDPSMAPEGHSSLYLLVPVGNLRGTTDWRAKAPEFRAMALRRLAALGLPEIESRIRYERMVTPLDWRDEFSVGFGATFNLAHDLRQMLNFRPGNRFGDTEGVYLVGGGTHPGSGLPVIYEGARISADLLARDLGLGGISTALPMPGEASGREMVA
ncbi:phytoene desaturase family protein [Pseudoroseomonas cervicalis]|uniref:phytoene desaturase family protein n=1 Tax=Teichococcus cervicalis TaxID=204525 RepID=UPI002783B883|nr:phytoene desaturase family protein [Pseudoroseomonas cervicalis]MDQ1080564.1 phytoene desaturase [Pseudoroseomonas cervicalis]